MTWKLVVQLAALMLIGAVLAEMVITDVIKEWKKK